MSDYLFSRIRLGDIISIRYANPKRPQLSYPRDILVIAPNYENHLHGIKLNGLTVPEQEYLQQLLYLSYNNAQDIFSPLEAQVEARRKEIELLNKQRNDLVRRGHRVIMTPAQSGIGSVIDKTKQILGSVIGKVNTFGRTQTQPQPTPDKNNIDLELQKNDVVLKQKTQELNNLVSSVAKNKQILQSVPRIPTDPYAFYHMFFKRFIGNNRRMKDIYRKFNIAYIKNPRILRSTGMILNAQRR